MFVTTIGFFSFFLLLMESLLNQVLISVGSGPLDQLFGGGNSPAFAVGALAAFVSGLVAIIGIPRSQIAGRRGQR